jgi:transcriptional antiterminator RfaH
MIWKVLYVASRSEKKVNKKLSELGLESYVPLRTERRKWSDRIKTVSIPIISGYVFVKVDEKTRDAVFKAQGVLNYVRYNGGDAVIRDVEITALKSIEAKGYFVEGTFLQSLQPDDKVLIKYGPFKGLMGAVKNISGGHVYRITIDSIKYSLVVNVPSEILEKK